jgi:NADH:ubiquinone oxidoreductase subunit F (NADH-binding)
MSGGVLLAGPELAWGAETYRDHVRRLGPLPPAGPGLIETLERSGLRGRGGAAFPVGAKWRSVASRSRGAAVVVVNGAEGEPLSRKDRALLAARPHLVLDGAFLAAATVGASEVVLYVGEEHSQAYQATGHALNERPETRRVAVRLVAAPARYVAGEESAAVHFLNSGVAAPTTVPPRPYEKGVGGRPTLVQNVESLAHAALVARFGDAWFHSLGVNGSAGTLLVTVAGGVRRPGVIEVRAGTSVGHALELAGGVIEPAGAVLVGGYFGGWVDAGVAWSLPLDADALRAHGASLGCGVIAPLPESGCGPCETAAIMTYLANESAFQCGPCIYGLHALADATRRLTGEAPDPVDLQRLRRWSRDVRGRGACRHPDGAVGLLQSALHVFEDGFATHRPHLRPHVRPSARPHVQGQVA